MLSQRGIHRLSPNEITEMARLREIVREAADILKRFPKPDTFIGRKTQEPFPKETKTAEEKNNLENRRVIILGKFQRVETRPIVV